MKAKDVIGLVLGLIILRLLLPTTVVGKLFFKEGVLVKVKWLDGSVSKLKKGKWIHK